MAHIVVLGAGIGGLPAAYELRRALPGHRVTVVSATEEFRFVPSNPWIAVGWREPRQVTVPLRPALERRGIGLVAQAAARVEAEADRLRLADGSALDYDYLVIATGPALAFDEVPGLGPDAHTHSICTLEHATRARAAYERLLAAPGPMVIGAAPGASCFGPAYEFALIVDADLRRRKLRDRVPITFVTSEPYIGHLGLAGVGDSKGLLEAEFRRRDIRWLANARIVGADAGEIAADELDADGAVRKRHVLLSAFAMILPAFRGVPAVAAAAGLCNPRGFVQIDAHQRNPSYRKVFAVGVGVAMPPVEATPVPTGAPKTGYMIESMVSAVVANIAADLDGRPAEATATWNAICLADMGDRGLAFVALPQFPPRNVMWTAQGRWVHWAKVLFEKYFLRKMRRGDAEPAYERVVLRMLGIGRLAGR